MKYIDIPNIRERRVGEESSKTYIQKIESGFFDKYMSGLGCELGFDGYISNTVPILPDTIGINKNTPGYNGINLPFEDNHLDYVYNSHVYEHIKDRSPVLREWMRVLKEGGHLIIAVPHRDLYEKKLNKPSRYNEDHQIFFTPSILLKEIEDTLPANSYRVKLLEDGDSGYDYTIPPEKHCVGDCQIVLVLQKIKRPLWEVK